MDLQNIDEELQRKKSSDWKTAGELFALNLFHKAALEVPAYKNFLKKNKINPNSISTFKDLDKVPFTDKTNYIDKYSLNELSWGGQLAKKHVITASSGSTGKAYFWPCSEDEFMEGASIHEYIFSKNFQINKHSTLIVVCFGMGTWVAGIYTFLSSYLINNNTNTIGIMTPGFNKEEAVRILNEVSPLYEQTIIAGYPTFVKDLIEKYSNQNKQDTKIKLKFLFAGEGFTESWRDYLLGTVGNSTIEDTINILGSADATLMGFETKESINIRRWAQENKSFSEEIFNNERIPSLQSYIPTFRFFHSYGRELLLSANRAIPFVRYNIHDVGNILTFNDAKAMLNKHGYSFAKNSSELPFVYVFGRGKFTVTIYAANIYPENIRDVLFHRDVNKFITGRFLVETKSTEKHDQYLDLKIELAHGVKKSDDIQEIIMQTFMVVVTKQNTEYKRIVQEYGIAVSPKITLYPYKDKLYFSDEKIKKTG